MPIYWRVLVALTTYLYVRASEAKALGWEDVDLTRVIVKVHRAFDRTGRIERQTKGKQARTFRMEANLLPLLDALSPTASTRDKIIDLPTRRLWATSLRRDLAVAGVDRAELYAEDKTRKHITFHDLRATGITWLALRGEDPITIMHRAGHKAFSTTNGYIRDAHEVREVMEEPFPELPDELLEEVREDP